MPYPICRHVKINGYQCQSPAVRDSRHCYYHGRLSTSHSNFRSNPRLDPFFEPGRHIRLVAIEDRASLQMALSQTVNAIAVGQIDLKSAKAILYGLQLAAAQLKAAEAINAIVKANPEALQNLGPMVQTFEPTIDHLDLAPTEIDTTPQLEGEIVMSVEKYLADRASAQDRSSQEDAMS